MSPLLFNIFLNPLIEWLHQTREGYIMQDNMKIATAAFADDIALITKNKEEMETLWDRTNSFYKHQNMKIKGKKSAYTTNTKGGKTCTLVTADSEEITTLGENQPYQYLGVWLRLDGSWKDHIEIVDKRMNKVMTCLYL